MKFIRKKKKAKGVERQTETLKTCIIKEMDVAVLLTQIGRGIEGTSGESATLNGVDLALALGLPSSAVNRRRSPG